ncbi:hypothetical protein MI170_32160 [Mycolicibacterium goodii]|nr:hypothetical protein [Mycolicibacterium goodii]UVI51804.1 hypothetical protein MI170_32160 [Mycolicibacterium goodii]
MAMRARGVDVHVYEQEPVAR